MPPPISPYPVGNAALSLGLGLDPSVILRSCTYLGVSRMRESSSVVNGVERTLRSWTPSYAPDPADGLLGHVVFALKYELPHLGLLSLTFEKLEPAQIAEHVKAAPSSTYSRRIGYLYELLTERSLDEHLGPDFVQGNYTQLLDPDRVITGTPRRIKRWRVWNNLPGSRAYSPLIERTAAVKAAIATNWFAAVGEALASQGQNAAILQRASSYLFAKETRSSYSIERETPSELRAARFIEALKRAGEGTSLFSLSESSLAAIQNLIVDPRYKESGYRTSQNYIGSISRRSQLVHYVPPPPAFLPELMRGLAEAVNGIEQPLIQAAVASFGFVFHHPFDDGNGRLHRYLIHDSLARNKMIPNGLALPVSAAILENMQAYDQALEAYSRTVASVVDYALNDAGELVVTNPAQSAWVWRYPDLTPQVEYLARAMSRSVTLVAEEISFLIKYDDLTVRAKAIVDMPERSLADLLACIHANGGTLSLTKRKQRFEEITDAELSSIEQAYAAVGLDRAPQSAGEL